MPFTFSGLQRGLVAWVACAGCSGSPAVPPSGSSDAGAPEHPGSSPLLDPSTPETDASAARGEVPPQSTPQAEPVPLPEPDVLGPDDDDPPACERELTFEAVSLEAPPPFDVVIVADHSDSLSWSREDLASGLESLLDRVRGHDARFFVLTPTQYGASSAAAIDMITGEELVAWRDPATGAAYSHEVTEYTTSCVDADGATIPCPTTPILGQTLTMTGTWNLKLGAPAAEITAAMSGTEFTAQAATLRETILGLTGGGSQDEQPMCTLHRYLAQDPNLLPEHVVFIVLSDEDDQTSTDGCLSSYHYESGNTEYVELVAGCLEDCPVYEYATSVPLAAWSMSFSCVPVDDFGNTFPEQATSSGLPLSSTSDCGGVTARECTSGEMAEAVRHCGAATVVEGCTSTCQEGAAEKICLLHVDEPGLDPCTQGFERDGVTYDDYADYCAKQVGEGDFSQCAGEGLFEVLRRTPTAGGHAQSLLESSRIVDVIDDFKKQADARWSDRHFVEVIAFTEEFACVPGTGQSHASFLRYVATSQEDVFPICEPYAPALARVEDFSRALLQTEYAFELGEGEDIEAVEITDQNGAVRQLETTDYSYDFDAARLEIDANALTALDVSLTVQVARRCGEAR